MYLQRRKTLQNFCDRVSSQKQSQKYRISVINCLRKSFTNLFWKIYELKTGDTEKYDLNSNGSFFATSKTTDTDHLGKFTQKILAHSEN